MKIKKIISLVALLTILGTVTSCSQGTFGGGSSVLQSSKGTSTPVNGTGSGSGSGSGLFGSDLGSALGNLLEGVFSSSNITVADMQGEWTSAGPAVCFQSNDLLKKAGGIAAASAIETKLAPYYEQYGLNNAKMTVNADGTFTLVLKAIRLSGNITPKAGAEKGVFDFNFTVLGQKLATVPTYVQKTSQSMDVMFDATKLKKLLTALAQFSGNGLVTSVSGILDSYDGLCIGFNFRGGRGGNSIFGSGSGNSGNSDNGNLSNSLDILNGLINGNGKR